MIKQLLSLNGSQRISKTEQKNIGGGIPECWIYAIEAGCILIPNGSVCPVNTEAGICDSDRLCC